ncbi:cell division protein FtsK [Kribbella sp. NPDC048915]|uniref:cell division protein FtsK n=1 Tax=Kribbella sp. NPDC048915 TaxID=3155148 RepID=UPI0033D23000
MPDRRLSRRTVVATAALVPGAAALTGCKDDPAAGSGTPGAVNGKPSTAGEPGEETPTVDPAVVAALSGAATLVSQLSQLCATASRKYPALRPQLAAAVKYHTSHLAKLKETAGVAAKAGTVAVPATSQAALAAISQREKAAAVAAAAAAAKLSGAPARLLAQIAASETQLSSTLAPRKKATS